MHRAAVLLACVWSVFANSLQHSFFVPPSRSTPQESLFSSLSSYPEDLKYPVSRTLPSYNPYSRYEHSSHQYPSELAELTDDNVQEDVSSLVEPSVSLPLDSTNILSARGPWTAPPLHKALEDFDKGYTIVKDHFTKEALEDKDDEKFRYIVLLYTVGQLSKEVAKNGWKSYDRNYQALVRKYIQEAITNAPAAANAFYCAVQPGQDAMLPVRRVIAHPVVRYICKAQPTSCDATIWSILQYSSVTRHATEVLLAAGSAATTFLNNYSAVFKAISRQNAYKYLLDSRKNLRILVAGNAQALKMINDPNPKCKGPYSSNSFNRLHFPYGGK